MGCGHCVDQGESLINQFSRELPICELNVLEVYNQIKKWKLKYNNEDRVVKKIQKKFFSGEKSKENGIFNSFWEEEEDKSKTKFYYWMILFLCKINRDSSKNLFYASFSLLTELYSHEELIVYKKKQIIENEEEREVIERDYDKEVFLPTEMVKEVLSIYLRFVTSYMASVTASNNERIKYPRLFVQSYEKYWSTEQRENFLNNLFKHIPIKTNFVHIGYMMNELNQEALRFKMIESKLEEDKKKNIS